MRQTLAAAPGRTDTQNLRPAHLPALDLVRAVAMAGVIAIHTVAWAGRDTAEAALWHRVLDLLVRVSVPCFVMLTGVVLAHTSAGRAPALGDFVRRRLGRLAVPWLVWSGLWCIVYVVIVPVLSGDSIASGAVVLEALSQGPGYLYFLLLILQLSVVWLAFPATRRGRQWAAAGALAAQLGLSILRLAAPPLPAPLEWVLRDHAYELGVFWIGYFAIGVAAGTNAAALQQATPRRVLSGVAVAGVSFPLLVAAPALGLWDAERLAGANAFLHPLYVPAACSLSLLLLWASRALVQAVPPLGAWAAKASAASFGVYLVHQYFLDAFGPLLQPADALLRVSDPLPGSLPALLALFVGTLGCAMLTVGWLRRTELGRLVLGEESGRRV